MDDITRRYVERTPGSAALAREAGWVMPGGDTRSAVHHPPYTLTIDHALGATLVDVDGNDYLDLAGNFTSLVHGNAFPPVVAAVQEATGRGSAWPARSLAQVRLAEELVRRVPSVDLVRFTNSGTEANMLAVRVARHVTGRSVVLMARYGYHGSSDELEAGFAGRETATTRLGEYGDVGSFARALAGGEVAAVILEPVMGSAGVVSPPAGFLAEVQDLARRHGALFIADEVVTLRLAVGGAQSLSGLAPDLTTFGKIIGGGLPVGAVGGSARIMERLDPSRDKPIWHSGTFNGNPVTMAAGVAALQHLTATEIARIDQYAAMLADQLPELAGGHGLPFSVRRAGSLLNFYFSPDLPPASLVREDSAAMGMFHLACLNQGVFFPSRGLLATSTAMDELDVESCLAAMSLAMTDLRRAVDSGAVSCVEGSGSAR